MGSICEEKWDGGDDDGAKKRKRSSRSEEKARRKLSSEKRRSARENMKMRQNTRRKKKTRVVKRQPRVLWKWNSNSIASSSRFCGPIVIRAHTQVTSQRRHELSARRSEPEWKHTTQHRRGGEEGERRKEKRNILNASHVQRRYLACWL